MITRRQAIWIGITAPAWASSPQEFWNEKKPADWTEAEIQQLLTKSPWAKDASVSYYGGPGGNTAARAPRPGQTSTSTTSSASRRRGSGGGSPSDVWTDTGSKLQYRGLVRWE